MGWLKRDFVDRALGKLGLLESVAPDQKQDALVELDSMMGAWYAAGIRLGFPLPSTMNGSTLDEQTNVPVTANAAIYMNLAIWIAPDFGKAPSQNFLARALSAYEALLSPAAIPNEMQLPSGMPAGAGNRGQTYLPGPEETLAVDYDSDFDFS